MSPVQRKSSIRKAPAADVVEAITRAPEATANPSSHPRDNGNLGEVTSPNQPEVLSKRVAVGRPRGRRRMEPFSSKIEISLRDRLDEYLRTNDMTVVDFLDDAIKDRLEK